MTTDYEIRTYKTQEHYDNYDADVVLDGFTRKRDALREGKLWLTDHAIVKVQSGDREYIELLTMKGQPQP